jgi:hypothetical protein
MSESDSPQTVKMPQPVAWAVMLADGDRVYDVYVIEEEAKAIDEAVAGNHGIAPLYRSPTLTDAEREAIERAIAAQEHRAAEMHPRSWIAADIDDDCDRLRALLERTR